MTENNVDLTKNWQICVIFGSSKKKFLCTTAILYLIRHLFCGLQIGALNTLVSTSLEKAVLVSLLWIKAGSHYAALR